MAREGTACSIDGAERLIDNGGKGRAEERQAGSESMDRDANQYSEGWIE